MRVVGAEEIDRVLAPGGLVDALAAAFRGAIAAPDRHHHAIPRPAGDATLLLMPAWTEGEGGFVGVKVVSVYPGNAARGLASVQGSYLLLDGAAGSPVAVLDGTRLTLWRTAAASALAARYLAREDCRRMVMVGAGALAPYLIRAHRAERPIEDVAIWSRRSEAAAELAHLLAREGVPARATQDLAGEVREADLVSCATLATAPLVRGEWLKPGAHLDLVGAFNLSMREADDRALERAEVYIDTSACTREGGDVAVAIRAGTFSRERVRGDLADLVSGRVPGRTSPDAITLLKSVGASLEDLAAATLVWQRLD